MTRVFLLLLLAAPTLWAEDVIPTTPAPLTGAEYKKGVGIRLSDATRVAIGLRVADVADGTVTTAEKLIGQVYRTAQEQSQNLGERPGFAYASAMVTPASARGWAPGQTVACSLPDGVVTGKVVNVDQTMLTAGVEQVDVLLEIPDAAATLKIGAFVDARAVAGGGVQTTMVPRGALLETAQGDFVFVSNGDALLRTPVTTGVRGEDSVEIVDGLYTGDVVAAQPVETLYLIELRATKGGGHCH